MFDLQRSRFRWRYVEVRHQLTSPIVVIAKIRRFSRFICPELLKAIDGEPETDVLMTMLDSLAKCIQQLGPTYIDQESLAEILRIVDKMMQAHFEKANDRHNKHLDEDYDEEVQEQLEDEESDDIYILAKIADVLHSLFMTYRENFLPYFDRILNHFVMLLQPNRNWADHQWGICVFDDVIEFTGTWSNSVIFFGVFNVLI